MRGFSSAGIKQVQKGRHSMHRQSRAALVGPDPDPKMMGGRSARRDLGQKQVCVVLLNRLEEARVMPAWVCSPLIKTYFLNLPIH